MKKSIADSVARLSMASAGKAEDLPTEDGRNISADILYRSNRHDRDMLKRLALDEHSSVQAVLHEAINDLLIKRGKPTMGPAPGC